MLHHVLRPAQRQIIFQRSDMHDAVHGIRPGSRMLIFEKRDPRLLHDDLQIDLMVEKIVVWIIRFIHQDDVPHIQRRQKLPQVTHIFTLA